MSNLRDLHRQRRELLAVMKAARIKRIACRDRQDARAFRRNLELAELDEAIRKAKACASPSP